MNIRDRLDRLEAAIGGGYVDEGEPCEVCGAPATTRRSTALVVRIDDEGRCDGCGRLVDEVGPFITEHIIHIVRPPHQPGTDTKRR